MSMNALRCHWMKWLRRRSEVRGTVKVVAGKDVAFVRVTREELMRFTMFCLLLMSCSFASAQSKPVPEIKYDKFKDFTRVLVRVGASDEEVDGQHPIVGYVGNIVGYICPGNTTHCVPRNIQWLVVYANGVSIERSHDLTFLADGKRLPMLSTAWSPAGDDQNMDVSISVALFRKIARAETLEAQIGIINFKLNAENLAKLRCLADEMGASAKEKHP
jgi:hypothetical protein